MHKPSDYMITGQINASLSYKIEVNPECMCQDIVFLPEVQNRNVDEMMSFTTYVDSNRPECSFAQYADRPEVQARPLHRSASTKAALHC